MQTPVWKSVRPGTTTPTAVSGAEAGCTSASTSRMVEATMPSVVAGPPPGVGSSRLASSNPVASPIAMVVRRAPMCAPPTSWERALNCSRIGGLPPAVVPTPISRIRPSAINSSTIAETVGLASVVARAMLALDTRPPVFTRSSTSERLTSRIVVWSAPRRGESPLIAGRLPPGGQSPRGHGRTAKVQGRDRSYEP